MTQESNGFRRRRLEKELEDFPTRFSLLTDKTGCILAITWSTPHDRVIRMELPMEYPFKPPIIYVNGKSLVRMSMDSKLETMYWQRYQECPCTCCFSFVGSRWSPCLSLKRAVDQLVEREKKCFIVYFSMVNQVFQDILPSDIVYRIADFL